MTSFDPPQAQTSMFGNVYPGPGKFSDVVRNLSDEVTCGPEFPMFHRSVSRTAEPETAAEAIERVYDNASDEWKAEASRIIHRLCRNRREFDLDDVAEALKPIDHLPHEPRALGQLMRKVRKDRWCRLVRYEKSKRKSRHYGIISVDESLIFSPSA